MNDTNASSSETGNITVVDVSYFPESLHLVYKKAYKISIGVFEVSNYRECIGLNLHPLAAGDYTMVAEYFPPLMQSITANIGTGSISGQLSTTIP